MIFKRNNLQIKASYNITIIIIILYYYKYYAKTIAVNCNANSLETIYFKIPI